MLQNIFTQGYIFLLPRKRNEYPCHDRRQRKVSGLRFCQLREARGRPEGEE